VYSLPVQFGVVLGPWVSNSRSATLCYATLGHICELRGDSKNKNVGDYVRHLCLQVRPANQPTITAVALCHKNMKIDELDGR
jgi:hypothetical protein